MAVVYYVAHWRRSLRGPCLLFANLNICAAVLCFLYFLVENVVPEGVPARSTANGALTTTLLIQLAYAVGAVYMPVQLHFVLRYCGSTGRLARNLPWVYAGFCTLIPLIWLTDCVVPSPNPVAATSSWTCMVPWMPEARPASLAFVSPWILVQFYTQFLLWQHQQRQPVGASQLGVHPSVIRFVLVIEAGGAVISSLNGALGFTGIDAIPVVAAVAAVVLLLALDSGRRKRTTMRLRGRSPTAATSVTKTRRLDT